MKIERKELMGIIAVFAIGIILASYGVGGSLVSEAGNAQEIEYNSKVCVYHNGDLVGCSPNTLLDSGKNLIKDRLTGGAGAAVNYIALCNATNGTVGSCDTPAAADTAFDGQEFAACGLTRAQDTTVVPIGTGNWSYSNKFTATCDNLVTNVTGLFNATAGSGSVYFAGNTFSSVTLQNGDQLNVTWYIWIS